MRNERFSTYIHDAEISITSVMPKLSDDTYLHDTVLEIQQERHFGFLVRRLEIKEMMILRR